MCTVVLDHQFKIQIEMGEIGIVKFKVGQAIKAQYTNPSDGWIRVDLYDESNNILLHFNPRWDTKLVVLNSMIDGRWGGEERLSSGYDFTAEKGCTVELLATESAISIFLDGRHFHDYKHRLPIESVVKAFFICSTSSGTSAKLQYLEVKF